MDQDLVARLVPWAVFPSLNVRSLQHSDASTYTEKEFDLI